MVEADTDAKDKKRHDNFNDDMKRMFAFIVFLINFINVIVYMLNMQSLRAMKMRVISLSSRILVPTKAETM